MLDALHLHTAHEPHRVIIHSVTVTLICSISIPVDFKCHFVGKTLRNVIIIIIIIFFKIKQEMTAVGD